MSVHVNGQAVLLQRVMKVSMRRISSQTRSCSQCWLGTPDIARRQFVNSDGRMSILTACASADAVRSTRSATIIGIRCIRS